MNIKSYIITVINIGMFGCNAQNVNYTYESETLIIEQGRENKIPRCGNNYPGTWKAR